MLVIFVLWFKSGFQLTESYADVKSQQRHVIKRGWAIFFFNSGIKLSLLMSFHFLFFFFFNRFFFIIVFFFFFARWKRVYFILFTYCNCYRLHSIHEHRFFSFCYPCQRITGIIWLFLVKLVISCPEPKYITFCIT